MAQRVILAQKIYRKVTTFSLYLAFGGHIFTLPLPKAYPRAYRYVYLGHLVVLSCCTECYNIHNVKRCFLSTVFNCFIVRQARYCMPC